MLVYLPCGDIILAGKCDIQITLIIPQIEIHLSSVVKHKDFAMPVVVELTPVSATYFFNVKQDQNSLCGSHGSGINIHVGVDFDRRNVHGKSATGHALSRRDIS